MHIRSASACQHSMNAQSEEDQSVQRSDKSRWADTEPSSVSLFYLCSLPPELSLTTACRAI